jgi:hypothetical protein
MFVPETEDDVDAVKEAPKLKVPDVADAWAWELGWLKKLDMVGEREDVRCGRLRWL